MYDTCTTLVPSFSYFNYKLSASYTSESKTASLSTAESRAKYYNSKASVSSEELHPAGNAIRYSYTANGNPAMLNLFYNKDGTTTISPTGKNQEYSVKLKALIEKNIHTKSEVTAEYSYKNLSQIWLNRLIEYLKSLEKVEFTTEKLNSNPPHNCYKFTSPLGDKLTVNIYENNTLTLQGKPAYLYGEALSLLSYCSDISFDEVINTTNAFNQANIDPTNVRAKIKELLPTASKNIDETIIKLLSPSIALRNLPLKLEDYSCYAFPALRALEAYLKYLFGLKGVYVGHTFNGIFKNEHLTPAISCKISSSVFQKQIEKLYYYFKSNRHVIFHTDQILVGTTILDNKQEADDIVNQVIHLIESSYVIIKSEI